MQFKYIAAALSSLAISGVVAAPTPNDQVLENGLVARAEQAEQAKQAEQGKQAKQFYPGINGGGVNPLAFGGPVGGGFGPGFNNFGPNGLGGGGSATQWSNDQSFAANSNQQFSNVNWQNPQLFGNGGFGGQIPCFQCGGNQWQRICQWGPFAGQFCI